MNRKEKYIRASLWCRTKTVLFSIAILLLLEYSAPFEAAARGAQEAQENGAGLFNIAVTVGMLADIVAQVAGPYATVENIIKEGVDPHLYVPTRTDVQKLLDADMIFFVGLLLEGRMGDTLEKLERQKPVYAIGTVLDSEQLLYPAGNKSHPDPHIWMDVNIWKYAVMHVAAILAAEDPAHSTEYRDNADNYIEDLERLDTYIHEVTATIPPDQRVLVTAHDAFQYFGRAYDIQVHGIQGLSTESEAGLYEINWLIDFLIERDIGAVFVESSVSDRNVRALVEGTAVRSHPITIGGSLFSDAMGAPGTYEGTYIGMLDHNATVIASALGGSPPVRGLNGKLNIENNKNEL